MVSESFGLIKLRIRKHRPEQSVDLDYGLRVKLTSYKSALNPPMIYSTDRSKAVVPVLVSFSSWCLGRPAVCDCGTPWTFYLHFLCSL